MRAFFVMVWTWFVAIWVWLLIGLATIAILVLLAAWWWGFWWFARTTTTTTTTTTATTTAPVIVVPTPAPAPVPPAPPVTPAPPTVTVPDLICALADANGDVAKEAAFRLVATDGTVPTLVECYVDVQLRPRAKWCLQRKGEEARTFYNKVLSNPNCYHPRVVVAVRKLLGNPLAVEETASREAVLANNLAGLKAEQVRLTEEVREAGLRRATEMAEMKFNLERHKNSSNWQQFESWRQAKAEHEALVNALGRLTRKVKELEARPTTAPVTYWCR